MRTPLMSRKVPQLSPLLEGINGMNFANGCTKLYKILPLTG